MFFETNLFWSMKALVRMMLGFLWGWTEGGSGKEGKVESRQTGGGVGGVAWHQEMKAVWVSSLLNLNFFPLKRIKGFTLLQLLAVGRCFFLGAVFFFWSNCKGRGSTRTPVRTCTAASKDERRCKVPLDSQSLTDCMSEHAEFLSTLTGFCLWVWTACCSIVVSCCVGYQWTDNRLVWKTLYRGSVVTGSWLRLSSGEFLFPFTWWRGGACCRWSLSEIEGSVNGPYFRSCHISTTLLKKIQFAAKLNQLLM